MAGADYLYPTAIGCPEKTERELYRNAVKTRCVHTPLPMVPLLGPNRIGDEGDMAFQRRPFIAGTMGELLPRPQIVQLKSWSLNATTAKRIDAWWPFEIAEWTPTVQ